MTTGRNATDLEGVIALRLPAGRPHAVTAVTQFKMMLILVREGQTP